MHKEDIFGSIDSPNEEVICAFGMCHGSSGLEVLLVLAVCAWHLDSLEGPDELAKGTDGDVSQAVKG